MVLWPEVLQAPIKLELHFLGFLAAFMLDIEDSVGRHENPFALDLDLKPLQNTRYAKHFKVMGDKSIHYGPFKCAPVSSKVKEKDVNVGGACC